MARRPTDRRVVRTHSLLRNAHLALILKNGYDVTTVEDICKEADVGRSTFYAHFRDKDDLRRSGLEQLRVELREHQRQWLCSGAKLRPGLSFSLKMFEHARDHLELYRALRGGRGGSIALDCIRRMLVELARAELPANTHRPHALVDREIAVQYVVGAYMSVLTWWMERGATQSPEHMDAIFMKATLQGVSSLPEPLATLGTLGG